MAPSARPKALLFDIGGVCVVSPLSAILAYERANNIPVGWINHAISRSGRTGAWQRIERGEVPMDAAWFAHFAQNLREPAEGVWAAYCARAAARQQGGNARDAKELPPLPASIRSIDAEWLFWEMMRISRTPDAHMLPALWRLKDSGRFLIGALSNTTIYPTGHPFNARPEDPRRDVRKAFDVFVSSAHVGLRKPERDIYELAMRWLGDAYREGEWEGQGMGELRPSDVVFLDDIGENLKAAKQLGMRTIKVGMGNTKAAVRELEAITGMDLLEENAKL